MGASSETALIGRYGRFSVDGTLVARTTQWEINPKLAQTSEWGDSDSKGWTNRAGGRKDCTFSTEGKFDTEAETWELFEVGDHPRSILYMNKKGTDTGDADWTEDENLRWLFPRALNTDYKLTINIDSEEVVGWTADWGADGKMYRPGETES